MNILSLFDGVGCGLVALKNLGIDVNTYYRSEIDENANKVFNYNHSDINTIELGDVKNIKIENIHNNIDLLMGGSPCQNFSFIGNRKGMVTKENIEITSLEQYLELKNKNFIFEGQSFLFWEYIRILKEAKPKWFLLENVVMAKKWSKIITNTLKVEPILIDSALFSAQRRKRLYWTNIHIKELPKDNNILLKNVLDFSIKFQPLKPFVFKTFGNKKRIDTMNWVENEKANTLTTNRSHTTQYLLNKDKTKMRLLSRLEYERLQTLPEDYTKILPITKACKAIGNGWNIKTIEHIFQALKDYK